MYMVFFVLLSYTRILMELIFVHITIGLISSPSSSHLEVNFIAVSSMPIKLATTFRIKSISASSPESPAEATTTVTFGCLAVFSPSCNRFTENGITLYVIAPTFFFVVHVLIISRVSAVAKDGYSPFIFMVCNILLGGSPQFNSAVSLDGQ